MQTTNQTEVQVYDKVVEKTYYKILGNAFWNSKEVLKVDRICDEVVVNVNSDKLLKVVVNGEEYIKK